MVGVSEEGRALAELVLMLMLMLVSGISPAEPAC